MFQAKFTVPSYYEGFSCKGKECRNCCCQGWLITLTEKEYFSLHSLSLPKEEEEKVEAYVGIKEHLTVDDYGRINLTFEGKCPFRRKKDGYCALQVLCGEEKIPSVCRYYPRAPRLYPVPECSISNSCEWVIEELIHSKEKLRFHKKTLSFAFDDEEKKEYPVDFTKKRNKCLAMMEDRRFLMPERLKRISLYLGQEPLEEKEIPSYLEALKKATSRSYSLGEEVSKMNPQRDPSEREKLLIHKIPYYEIRAEKIFANHLLFAAFPYVNEKEDFFLASRGLEVIYRFYQEILLSNLPRYNREKFVDISASFFRLAEHSNLYELIESITHEIEK